MSNVEPLFSIDYLVVITGVLVILIGGKYLFELFAWYKRTFRLKTGADQDKELSDATIEKLKEHDKEQYETIQKILSKVEDLDKSIGLLEKSMVQTKIEEYRFQILNMASHLGDGQRFTREHFERVLHLYDEYEQILEKYEMTNGQVEASIEVIRLCYQERLKNGF